MQIKSNKGSVLMVSMWVLAILATFAVGIAYRASVNLKLGRLQRDSARSYFLATAGIERAKVELKNDLNSHDSLLEPWSTGKDAAENPLFEDIGISTESGGTFTVRIIDEERKININTAPDILINTLLQESGIDEANASAITGYIRLWRGDNSAMPETDTETYNNFKRSPFNNCEELRIPLEYFYRDAGSGDYRARSEELYGKLRGLVTVYPATGTAKTNINTASPEALGILIKSAAAKLNNAGASVSADPAALVNMILEYRRDNIFSDINLAGPLDLSGPAGSDLIKIINQLKELIGTESQNFRIISAGKITGSGASRAIECVFNRRERKIIHWHES